MERTLSLINLLLYFPLFNDFGRKTFSTFTEKKIRKLHQIFTSTTFNFSLHASSSLPLYFMFMKLFTLAKLHFLVPAVELKINSQIVVVRCMLFVAPMNSSFFTSTNVLFFANVNQTMWLNYPMSWLFSF